LPLLSRLTILSSAMSPSPVSRSFVWPKYCARLERSHWSIVRRAHTADEGEYDGELLLDERLERPEVRPRLRREPERQREQLEAVQRDDGEHEEAVDCVRAVSARKSAEAVTRSSGDAHARLRAMSVLGRSLIGVDVMGAMSGSHAHSSRRETDRRSIRKTTSEAIRCIQLAARPSPGSRQLLSRVRSRSETPRGGQPK
jgi:hypothetical protein